MQYLSLPTKQQTPNQRAAMRSATAKMSLALARKYDVPCDFCDGQIHGETYFKHIPFGWLAEHCKQIAIQKQLTRIAEKTRPTESKIATLKSQKRRLFSYREQKAIDQEITNLNAAIKPFKRKERRLNDLLDEVMSSVLDLEIKINTRHDRHRLFRFD